MEQKGPNYISWAEHVAAKKRTLTRRMTVAGTAAVILMMAALAVVLVPPWYARYRLRALAESLANLHSYHCTVYAVDEKGQRSVWLEETKEADGTLVSALEGKITHLAGPGGTVTEDVGQGCSIAQQKWDPDCPTFPQYVASLIMKAIRGRTWSVVEASAPGGANQYRIFNPVEQWTLSVDRGCRPVSVAVDRLDLTGWKRREDANFSYSDLPAQPSPLPVARVAEWKNRNDWAAACEPVIAKFPYGEQQVTLMRADANSEGVAFLLLKKADKVANARVTDAAGRQGYDVVSEWYDGPEGIFSNGQRPTALEVLPRSDRVPAWPMKLHLELTGPHSVSTSSGVDGTDVGDLDVAIPAPSCTLLPYYLQPGQASDVADLQYQETRIRLLAEFYAHVMRYPNGEAVGQDVDPAVVGGRVRMADREDALGYYLEMLRCREELLESGGPAQDIALVWLKIYDLLSAMGRREDAIRALNCAVAYVSAEESTPETASRIHVATRLEGVPEPKTTEMAQ